MIFVTSGEFDVMNLVNNLYYEFNLFLHVEFDDWILGSRILVKRFPYHGNH